VTDQQTALRDLPNLGPASERMLVAAGVRTPADLDRIGSVEAFRRVVASGGEPSLNLLWAMEGALLGLDWRDVPPDVRDRLTREVEETLQGDDA
jgi:DNA transformation protein